MTSYTGIGAALQSAAKAWPDKAAFRHRDDVLSYKGLWDQARALAACLVQNGVEPGDRVAIAMTKGLEMPVAIHGIWMAGAAFVPFDPGSPTARLAGIIDDCAIAVVISAARNAPLAKSLAEARNITLVGIELEGTRSVVPEVHLGDFTPRPNAPDDLAYIIFTSGSTGAPKGICHTHASGRAFAEAWLKHYELRHDDVFFSTVPLHFDFSLADFFVPSDVGATTELVAEPLLMFPASLAEHLQKVGGTIWSSVPYTFTQLCERGAVKNRDLSCLRWLIYGGEPMPPSSLPDLRRVFFGAQISNSYGPAEVNQCNEYTVPEDHPADQPIPIGQPMQKITLEVDEGELLVASPAMMRGYWNRPDLNAEAFVDIHGQRFYRTGDHIAKNPDGLWVFSGREDRLVKVRGHRVELDEIELNLVAHPAVAEAGVVKAADGLTIAAYVTIAQGATASAVDLKSHLSSVLPNYAVPDHIEVRGTLEKTSTGKINRKALVENV